ncbi:dTDP-4-dehydrorhamnose 3,5-epimerase family protein [Chloroflexota bacterium]
MTKDKKHLVSRQLIDGASVKPLKWMTDERGKLMEILRCDNEVFTTFGQVYVTTCFPGVVKGWHYHKKQDDNMAVIKGMAKIALYDDRAGSATRGIVNELFVGEDNPTLITIPAGVLHGFKAYGMEPAYIINTVTLPYNADEPDEYRVDPFDNDIFYDWSLKQG